MPDSKHLSTVRAWISHCFALSIAGLIGWVAYLAGVLPLLDHLLYDHGLSIATMVRETPAEVLLVPASGETLASEGERQRLVSALAGLGARGIALTQPVAGDINTPGAAWVLTPQQFHDPRAVTDPRDNLSLYPVGAACEVGFVPAPDGIYRSQQMVFADRLGPRPSLEAAIAEQWFGGDWSRPGDRFFIRFQAGGESLPTVPADLVLDDGLVPELVRGRMVLIGPERSLDTPGLTGPVSGLAPMSPLEYHGHAVNSLLTQTWIRVPPLPLVLAVVALCSVLTYALCVRFPQQRRRLLGLLLGLELCTGWIGLTFAGIWFPVGMLWGGQALAVFCCSAHSRWRFNDLTSRLAFQIRSSLQLRQEGRGTAETDDPWKELAEFIRHLIPVSELAVYEMTARRQRQRMQKHLWRNGAAAEGELDESVTDAAWAVLDRLPENMTVAAIPLPGDGTAYAARVTTFSGVRGELILAPASGAEQSREPLESQIRMVIEEVEHRATAKSSGHFSQHPGRSAGNVPVRSDGSANGLCAGLDRLRFEFALLEHAFDEMDTGLALYDASGIRMWANRCFRKYQSDQVGQDRTAGLPDLLTALLPSAADVRNHLRRLLLRKSPISVSIQGRSRSTEDHVRLRPIDYCWSSPLASVNAASVLRAQLVICEWSRTESRRQAGFDDDAHLMELVESLQGIVSHGVDGEASGGTGDRDRASRGGRRPLSVPEASAEPVHA